MTDYTSIKSKMQEVLQDKIQYKMKLEEQRERSEMLATENQSMKERVAEIEEEARGLRKQIKGLQAQAA